MLDVLAVTGPIYLLIAMGYVATRRGAFRAEDLRALSQYVVQFALSALVFRAVATRHFADILNGPFLLAYACGSLVALFTGLTVSWLRGRGLTAAAFTGAGLAVSNNGFIGSTLVVPLLGPSGGVALALVLLVENLLINPLFLTLAECGGQGHLPWYRVVLQSLGRVARIPLMGAIFVGVLVSLSGLTLPPVLARTVDLLAMSASAVALFVIGGTLVGRSLQGQHLPVLGMMLGKLVLHPLAVLVMLLVLPPVDPALRLGAVLFATMPMFSMYSILAQKYGLEGFAAATVVATTVVSFVTISGWLWVLRHGLGWG